MDADQLNTTVSIRGHDCIRGVAHPVVHREYRNFLRPTDRIKAVVVVICRVYCRKGAIFVDADQLDALFRAHEGMHTIVYLECGDFV